MTQKKADRKRANPQDYMPDAKTVAEELGKAQTMDDFFGKDGIFAKLFAGTLEQMMEAELTDHLGYEPYEAKGRNSGNSRNELFMFSVLDRPRRDPSSDKLPICTTRAWPLFR